MQSEIFKTILKDNLTLVRFLIVSLLITASKMKQVNMKLNLLGSFLKPRFSDLRDAIFIY